MQVTKPVEEELVRLRAENVLLRSIVAQAPIPCIYCGLEEMSKCAHGFPGCGRADDLLLAPNLPMEDTE